MSTSNPHTPVWSGFAYTVIGNLRRHHGVASSRPDGFDRKMEPPSELDELFARFEDGKAAEIFDAPTSLPSRYVPARQLLTAIRLAATFGGPDAYQAGLLCGALTVISDIAPADMTTLKDTLKLGLPYTDWQVISPDIIDGQVSKTAQSRFESNIADRIDRIEPVLILQADGVSLPSHLVAIAPAILPYAPVSRDIVMTHLLAGNLHDQIPDPMALHDALPQNVDLAALETLEACAALRAPTPRVVLQRLDTMIDTQARSSGPRLENFEGETPALLAARRVVDDLLLWKDGEAGWHEISRSLLLYGPPGTGKTFLARAIGNSAGLTTINASFAEWQAHGHLGDMMRAMDNTFSEARRRAPCLIIIDEIDAVGSRSDPDRHANNYRTQVINGFLGHLDSIAQREGVAVIGTCNHPGRMDPAVLRAGRMDLKIQVPLPDAEAILGILRHHLREDIADAELQSLAHRAVGRSAADIDAAIRAARSDARHTRKLLSLAMLHDTLGIETSGADDAVLRRVAIHEAGHAVLGAALGLGTIEAIAITNEGGHVQRRSKPTESLLSDIEAEISYALAGRAAERLVLGEVSAGAGGPAASDLALATYMAIQIETTYGLGHEGLVWHADLDIIHRQTPAIRDRVRQRLQRAEQQASILLGHHRDALEALARTLVEKRSMRTKEIRHALQSVAASVTSMTPKATENLVQRDYQHSV
ncbi:AAA family ATPase [Sulfitobacter sp. F26169L]|uniref:AAA family ATPase n=1 Tax=Sulfitobacter sp. F26169L TaxID=2996015 RepID=UPI002260C6FC|nr:AAA family ATPase [Sulfitobacter sp. F26169L]MCX7568069.1 AAA family ATPase [Sulfitobacter sp. F26169L]